MLSPSLFVGPFACQGSVVGVGRVDEEHPAWAKAKKKSASGRVGCGWQGCVGVVPFFVGAPPTHRQSYGVGVNHAGGGGLVSVLLCRMVLCLFLSTHFHHHLHNRDTPTMTTPPATGEAAHKTEPSSLLSIMDRTAYDRLVKSIADDLPEGEAQQKFRGTQLLN